MRPEVLKGKTKRVKTGCGFLYVTVNEKDGVPIEVFCRLGKAGGCASSQTESLGRLISMVLRGGGKVGEVVDQLRGVSCHQPNGLGPSKILSCADGVAKVLSEWIEGPEVGEKKVERMVGAPKQGACPDCGGPNIVYEEGCKKCRDCGWTECS
jgi:ribonucleoside-diphosphate reductase alpha chain